MAFNKRNTMTKQNKCEVKVKINQLLSKFSIILIIATALLIAKIILEFN